MVKMSDSAQVRMNVALRAATTTPLATVRGFDLTQASTTALRDGLAAIDDYGIWCLRYEDPPTDDMVKRGLIAGELRRRGESVPRVTL